MRIVKWRGWLGVPFVIALTSCSPHKPRVASLAIPIDPKSPQFAWTAYCNDPNATEPAYVSNGVIGLRIARDGSAVKDSLLVAGRRVVGTDEAIYPFPGDRILVWPMNATIGASTSGYSQSLDFHTGILTTRWTNTEQGKAINFSSRTLIPQGAHFVAQLWRVEAPAGYMTLDSLYDEKSPLHLLPVRVTLFTKTGLANLFTPGSANTPAVLELPMVYDLDYPPKQPENSIRAPKPLSNWKTDIIIDGPPEDQQAVRSWLFYLWSSVPDNSDLPVGPMGLSSTIYKGHVFWDSDIWMFPVLALTAPEKAKTIANYRLKHLPNDLNLSAQAKAQNQSQKLQGFPWESSKTGHNVAPPKWDNAKHITGDVAFMFHQAATLGLVDESNANSICRYAAEYFEQQSTQSIYTPLGIMGRTVRDLRHVVGPDEQHEVDNDLYTNSLAQWLEDHYRSKQYRYMLPTNREKKDSLVAFQNDPMKSYGQADAALAIYPIQNPEAEKQAEPLLRNVMDKTIPHGPAMTDSIHALILARLNKTDEAYSLWRKSWQDFSHYPLNLFSEKRNKDRTYFVTGAAGCLQTVLYGFLGFRIDWKKDPQAVWAKRLRGGDWLTLNPHLPKQWKKVTFRNFPLLGQRYTLVATHSGITVTQGENP